MTKDNNLNKIKNKVFNKELIIKIIVFVVITIALAISLFFSSKIEKMLKLSGGKSISDYNDQLGLKVSFIDVGQGDACFVELPDGKNMLIDCGPKENIDGLKKYFTDIKFDKDNEVIDYVIATHPHADHIDNMPYIFNKYKVLKAYVPKASSTKSSFNAGFKTMVESNTYGNFLDAVKAENCEVAWYNKDEVISGSKDGKNYEIKFWTNHSDKKVENLNNLSPVITISYNSKTFCLTGDAEKEVEAEAVLTNIGLVDVYKAGHHGSSTSSTIDFLNKIMPSKVVISVGADNKFGHPTNITLDKFIAATFISDVYRTDKNGTVMFFVDTDTNLFVASEKMMVAQRTSWLMIACLFDVLAAVVIFSIHFTRKNKPSKNKLN